MRKNSLLTMACCLAMLVCLPAAAQPERWQQEVDYQMEIDFDVTKHQFTGQQTLKYTNNSPDTLNRVFYHLFFNAFQPNSMMDVRSRTIQDPDRRVMNRIQELSKDEEGYLDVQQLSMNGQAVDYKIVGTILEVNLDNPIMPESEVTFEMDFTGQVPLQIRRSGRDSEEGIDYSMAQWFPKMAEYDYEGWHANPYIGREFHGVWGDFDVKIKIDKSYVVAASGYLQNPEQIGYGYEEAGQKVKRPKGDKLTWHFKAPNVHDFMWAADPDYVHTTAQVPDGPLLRFFYQADTLQENWEKLPEYTVKAFQYMNEHFGKYPYDVFSTIQGGDGGMEYAMGTLITGHRSLQSLVGVTVHELIHSWFQGVLATNESLYPWMDEGYTSYASSRVMAHLFDRDENQAHAGSYQGYIRLAKSGLEEPMTTHADHYQTNYAYGTASYGKGAVFLHQLSYIIGKEDFDKGMLRYFNTWKFKHPNPNDFKRLMEKESGLELDWYLQYWVNTTHTIDYSIKSAIEREDGLSVTLERLGKMPMPIDLEVEYNDGRKVMHNIPLEIMRGTKNKEDSEREWEFHAAWPWTNGTYTLTIPGAGNDIKRIEIDPSNRIADIDRENNKVLIEEINAEETP